MLEEVTDGPSLCLTVGGILGLEMDVSNIRSGLNAQFPYSHFANRC